MLFGLVACGRDTDPLVRFWNDSDVKLQYGIRVGEAEYDDDLEPRSETEYLVTVSGSYTIERKGETGLWTSVTAERRIFERGREYTVRITWTEDAGFAFALAHE